MLSWPDFSYKQLIVHTAGGSGEIIRFKAENLVIYDKEKKVLLQHSCHRIFALIIIGETTLTSAFIRQAVKFAFPIIMLTGNLRPYARINNNAEGNTLLRIRQYNAGERNLQIAQSLIMQKIGNQCTLLERLRYKADYDKNAIAYLCSLHPENVRDTAELMGMEGSASRVFFQAYFRNLNWRRREPRCKRDIVNLLLDIGYTYLFNFIEALLGLYGFDLYCGVLHTLFYQRKSLVCDIVEPFRCIIDARIRKAHSLNQIDQHDFGNDAKNGTFYIGYDKLPHTRICP